MISLSHQDRRHFSAWVHLALGAMLALSLVLSGCGDDDKDDGASGAPSCANLQAQINTCNFNQETKDQFSPWCADKSAACRSCLDGVLCGVTEQCDPACGKK